MNLFEALDRLGMAFQRWLVTRLKIDCYSLDGEEIVKHCGWRRDERLRCSQIDAWWVVHEMGFDIVVIEMVDGSRRTWIDKYDDLISHLRTHVWQRLRGGNDPN